MGCKSKGLFKKSFFCIITIFLLLFSSIFIIEIYPDVKATQNLESEWKDDFCESSTNELKIDESLSYNYGFSEEDCPNTKLQIKNTCPAWTDTSWTKMQKIELINSNPDIDEYIIHLIIECEQGMNQNFSDIRFKYQYQNDLEQFLPYWIDKKKDGIMASVWVKVPNLDLDDSDLYMFYGNPLANSQSSYNDSFQKWETTYDFEISNMASDKGGYDPDIEYCNNKFLIVWEELDENALYAKSQIRGGIYTIGQNPSAIENFLIYGSGFTYREEDPTITYGFNDQNFFVVFEHYENPVSDPDKSDIYGRIVTLQGTTPYEKKIIANTNSIEANPDVVFDPDYGRFFVVWEEKPSNNYNIYGKICNIYGNPSSTKILISENTKNEHNPCIAYDNKNKEFLIVWEETNSQTDYSSIKGRLFDENLNGGEIIVIVSDASYSSENPCVKYNDEEDCFMVTWDKRISTTNEDEFKSPCGIIIENGVKGDIFCMNPSDSLTPFSPDIIPLSKSDFFVSFCPPAANEKYIAGLVANSVYNDFLATNKILSVGEDNDNKYSAKMAFGDEKLFVCWENKENQDYPDIYGNIWTIPKVEYEIEDDVYDIITNAYVVSDVISTENLLEWGYFTAQPYSSSANEESIVFDILDEYGSDSPLIPNISPDSRINLNNERIRLRATLTRNKPSSSPQIDWWKVSWTSSNIPSDGLICHWKLDDRDGSPYATDSAGDFDGTLIDGTLNNDDLPKWVPGRFAQDNDNDRALKFDNPTVHQSVQIADTFDNQITDDFTLTAWINWFDSYGNDYPMIFDNRGNWVNDEPSGFELYIIGATNKIFFSFLNSYITSDNEISPNVWSHVTVVFDDINNKISIYINGSFVNDIYTDYEYQERPHIDDIYLPAIGNSHWIFEDGCLFDGIIDDIRIYNRALDPDEIYAIASGGLLPSVEINYSEERRSYKHNDPVTITADFEDINPNAEAYIRLEDENGSTILPETPMSLLDSTQQSWYYNWIVPSRDEAENGLVTVYITAKDGLGNEIPIAEPSYDAFLKIDNIAPIIITGPIHYIEENLVTIYANLSEYCQTTLQWGTTQNYGSTQKFSGDMPFFFLSELSENTTYYYKIRAADEAGNYVESRNSFYFISHDSYLNNDEKPVAITGGPYTAGINEPIIFNGTASYAKNGRYITYYIWDFDNDGTPDSYDPITTYSYDKVGKYTVSLRVIDNESRTAVGTTTAIIAEDILIETEELNETTRFDIKGSNDSVIVFLDLTPSKPLRNVAIRTTDYGDYKPEESIIEPIVEDLQNDSENNTIENISIYRYVDISIKADNNYIQESDISSSFIVFKVAKEWIENNDLKKENIFLLRNKNNSWQNLNTSYFADDEKNYFYYSNVPGFSTFAVVGSKVVEKGEPLNPEDKPIPWILIFGFIISAVVVLIFILFKTKFIYIEDTDTKEKEDEKK